MKNKFNVGDWFTCDSWNTAYPVTRIVDATHITLAYAANGRLHHTDYTTASFRKATLDEIEIGRKQLGELINQIPELKESKTFGHFDKVQCQESDGTWDTEVGIVDGTYMGRDGGKYVVVKWPSCVTHSIYSVEHLRHAVKPLVIANDLVVEKVDANTVKIGCTEIKKSEAKKVMELMHW